MTYEEPLCGECKAAKASVIFSIARQGRVRERRLMCAECAESYERLTFGNSPGVGLVRLVTYIADRHAERAGASSKTGCPICGTELAEVIANGAAGCGTCYSRFAAELDAVISATHEASLHRGKAPVA